MIDKVSYFFIFFGGFMSWTIALGTVLEEEKNTYHYTFAGTMFCLGGLQILDGLLVMEKIGDFSAFIFFQLPLLAWIGPLFFFSFKSANQDSFNLKPVEFLHFLIGFLIVLFMVPLITMDSQTKLSFIMSAPDITSANPYFQLYTGLFIAVSCTLIGYLIFFLRECFFMLNIRVLKEQKISPHLITFVVVSFPLFIIFFGSMLTMGVLGKGHSSYIKIIQLLTALSFWVTLALFVMEKKKINFFKVLNSQIKQRQYETSNLKNLDVSLVLSRIDSLMEEEKIFHDEDLSVNGLAKKLSIKPYQLSRIINENFGKNFNYFVNEYRIKEAKKKLFENSDRTIISVAYAVGFNSTTVFNEWFKRITGVSPKHFRDTVKNSQ